MFGQLRARGHAHVVLVWVALLPFLVRVRVAQVVYLSTVQMACREGMRYEIKGFGQCWFVGLVMSSSDVPLMPLGVMNTPPKWCSSPTHAARQQSCCAQDPMAHSREHVSCRFVAKKQLNTFNVCAVSAGHYWYICRFRRPSPQTSCH